MLSADRTSSRGLRPTLARASGATLHSLALLALSQICREIVDVSTMLGTHALEGGGETAVELQWESAVYAQAYGRKTFLNLAEVGPTA